MLLNALAPSISHAMNRLSGTSLTANGFAEICTVSGIKLIAINGNPNNIGAPSNGAPAKSKATAHCPFCLTHDGSAALPPSNVLTFAHHTTTQSASTLLYQAPPSLFSWAVALSRAPPQLS